MKPPVLEYVRPQSIDEAVVFLADEERFAKVLAGGQSLVPMMNFRLARPELLVDLACLTELSGIQVEPGCVRVGAMTPQRELETSQDAYAACPLLREALRHVGHQQTRSRGTVGGSLAHADPSAELPAVALALQAEVVARGPGGTRTIPAAEFFLGPYTSALEVDEILVEVRFPVAPQMRTGFTEFTRRAGDFALGGIAAAHVPGADGTADVRLAAFGVGARPVRLAAAEGVLAAAGLSGDSIEQAGAAASQEITPIASHGASPDYRRRLIGALVRRVLKEMIA